MFIRSFLIILLFISQVYANEASKDDVLEIYYDMPNLELLNNNASLKYQAKGYLSKKKKKLKYTESVIYVSKSYQTHTFRVKHYNNVKSIEEKHPLLSLVKRKDRPLLIELLKQDGIIYPMKLKYVLKNTSDSKDKESDIKTYKVLFYDMKDKNKLFSIEFQYPYFLNLFYALCFGLVGLVLIRVFFSKKFKEKR